LNVLSGIYNTLQELEVKGEKNCSYILGMCNVIKKQIEELTKDSIELE
jgi:hypothetical protein